jgi:hypothetical protein
MGLHSLRQVVEALIDLMVDLPAALLRVNKKLDEHANLVVQVLNEGAANLEMLRSLDCSLGALRQEVAERLCALEGWMQTVTRQQSKTQRTSEETREAIDQIALGLSATERLTIALDEAQLRSIAHIVAELMQEAGSPRTTRRTS